MITPTKPYNVFPKDYAPARSDEQTALFYNIMLSTLPEPVKQEISKYRLVVDVGCGYGAGTAMFATAFPGLWCIGMDVAPDAIVHSTKLYQQALPNIQFLQRRVECLGNNVDLAVCSNMLEHYDDPVPEFTRLTTVATKMIIVMVPHKEDPLTRYHRVTFTEHGPLPFVVNGFTRKEVMLYDCRGTGYWHGDQIIMVYRKAA